MASLRQLAAMIEHVRATLPSALFAKEESEIGEDRDPTDTAAAEPWGLAAEGEPALGGGGG